MLNIRIGISTETVKALPVKLQQAYRAGDVGLVKRVTALLQLSRHEPAAVIAAELGCSVASIYEWFKTLVYEGVDGLKVKWRGGRRSKLSKTQKTRLGELITAGPLAAGFASACWNAVMLQQLIDREFGVVYNIHYVAELLGHLGFSFQKARFVSDHLDEAKRLTWLSDTWPTFLAQAKAAGGLLLFGDEASFAQWGSLGYTWAPIGQQPRINTTGKRKAYKVFGLIEFFTGRLFHQGVEGKLNASTYIQFLKTVLAQTTRPLFLVQDGAPYHRAKDVTDFIRNNSHRLTVTHLPSYSPDYNPIEYLWRATKRTATHNHYFPHFADLVASVEQTLAALAAQPTYIQSLFTFYVEHMRQPQPLTFPSLPLAA
ncbi:MAG: IS630 family transposase [Aggregatilineales bacterium]